MVKRYVKEKGITVQHLSVLSLPFAKAKQHRKGLYHCELVQKPVQSDMG